MFQLTDEDHAFDLDGHWLELRRTTESSWVVSEDGSALGSLANIPSPPRRLEKTYTAARALEEREDIDWPDLLRWLMNHD